MLYVASDNDFLATAPSNGLATPNQWFVFGVTDAYLLSLGASHTPQAIAAIPEPQSSALLFAGLGVLGTLAARRKCSRSSPAVSPKAASAAAAVRCAPSPA